MTVQGVSGPFIPHLYYNSIIQYTHIVTATRVKVYYDNSLTFDSVRPWWMARILLYLYIGVQLQNETKCGFFSSSRHTYIILCVCIKYTYEDDPLFDQNFHRFSIQQRFVIVSPMYFIRGFYYTFLTSYSRPSRKPAWHDRIWPGIVLLQQWRGYVMSSCDRVMSRNPQFVKSA